MKQRRNNRNALRTCAVMLLVVGGLVLLAVVPTWAHHTAQHAPTVLQDIAFDQRLNEQVPLGLVFRDESGNPVQLRNYFEEKPVILALVYYECPQLCSLVLNGLLRTLRTLSFDAGDQFTVITVSFDPTETPTLAATKKEAYLQRYGRPGAGGGWHFLTGEESSIAQLTKAVGFRYTYDAEKDQYAHATGIMVLTPQGRVSRYFYGLEYSPRDLRLGLVEASANRIGSPVDQVLLYCYRYDPTTGKYGLIIMNFLRLAGAATVLVLGSFIVAMARWDRRKAQKVSG
ncbi:MAG: SCO family protein [Candidatus Methylomirabilales bacterium]